MNSRALVFRIVGLSFLAFAALSIYRGEFGVGRSGGMVITRGQDPESFWRGVILQIGAGCVSLYLGRSSRPKASAHLTGDDDRARQAEPAAERPKLPNYDPVFCGKVVKGAAYVCAGLIIAELAVLLLVHPSDDRCPAWILHPHERSAASVWLLAGLFTVLPALWACYIAVHWDDYYAGKMYDSLRDGPPQQLLLDSRWLVLMVMAGWCAFCAIPLVLMLGRCTDLHQYLNAFHV